MIFTFVKIVFNKKICNKKLFYVMLKLKSKMPYKQLFKSFFNY